MTVSGQGLIRATQNFSSDGSATTGWGQEGESGLNDVLRGIHHGAILTDVRNIPDTVQSSGRNFLV